MVVIANPIGLAYWQSKGLHLHLYGKHEARVEKNWTYRSCATSEALVDRALEQALNVLNGHDHGTSKL
jgi:hypothetical protein